MKNLIKMLLVGATSLSIVVNVQAQSDPTLKYLEDNFPKLTELFKSELSEYPAHYIFAVDVSGSMNKYQLMVDSALTPFFRALPDKDRVDVIPFGTEAMTSVLGLSGVIDDNVKNTLCNNIKTLYTNPSYTREFKAHTDVPAGVDGIAKVMQTNREYKVNVVVIITDFRNDQKGFGERKITSEDLQKMNSAIKAATGDVYTRFIALQLPVDINKPGYCLNQLSESVFSFDGYKLEIASADNDEKVIQQWFNQLKREIMVTKLKAIVHDANKSNPVKMEVERDIDGNVKANIAWEPTKLYPTIKIDSTTASAEGFTFENNEESFKQTTEKNIEVELGRLVHDNYGFHYYNEGETLNLGLSLPTPYDDELTALETVKPIPETSIESPGWVFTFFLTLRTTIIILILLILYIIGVMKAIARNRKLCFKANVTFYDANGNQIDDMVRIPKQSPSTVMTFGKGGSPRCKVDGADWQFVVKKKKGNPLLVFQKPCFVWSCTSKYVASGKSRSGKLTDSVRVKCGTSAQDITHGVRIKLTN